MKLSEKKQFKESITRLMMALTEAKEIVEDLQGYVDDRISNTENEELMDKYQEEYDALQNLVDSMDELDSCVSESADTLNIDLYC